MSTNTKELTLIVNIEESYARWVNNIDTSIYEENTSYVSILTKKFDLTDCKKSITNCEKLILNKNKTKGFEKLNKYISRDFMSMHSITFTSGTDFLKSEYNIVMEKYLYAIAKEYILNFSLGRLHLSNEKILDRFFHEYIKHFNLTNDLYMYLNIVLTELKCTIEPGEFEEESKEPEDKQATFIRIFYV